MMVTAMLTKNASVNSGSMPKMVVAAASITGRRRETLAVTTASVKSIPVSRVRSISSTSTMPFLISIPDRLSRPSNAVKVNGSPAPNSPIVTPLIDIGTSSQITSGWRNVPNKKIEISTMTIRLSGNCVARLDCASVEFSYSPPHSIT